MMVGRGPPAPLPAGHLLGKLVDDRDCIVGAGIWSNSTPIGPRPIAIENCSCPTTPRRIRATPADGALVAHDWWTYQVVTGIGGTAHYDPWPSLRYRQHGLNLVGANRGLRARLVRLSAFA